MEEQLIIVDAHSHLWLWQDTRVDGQAIRTLPANSSRSLFFGEEVQMLPPFMTDGRNTAETFLSNMDYARVSAAVVVQEVIDGLQNDYLTDVQRHHGDRLTCCGMPEVRPDRRQALGLPSVAEQVEALLDAGLRGIALPAHRLFASGSGLDLTGPEMMEAYRVMARRGAFLSLCLAEGTWHVGAVRELARELPTLRIAIGHCGMVGRPGWLEQVRLAEAPNVRIETGGITWLFHSEFYPYRGAIRALREAIDLVGPDRIMWGSDYPRTITAITYRMSYDFLLRDPDGLLSADERALLLGRNAMAFYGLTGLTKPPYVKCMSE